MKYRFFNLKRIILLCFFELLILLVLVALFMPYPYSQLFEKSDSSTTGSNTIDARYMSEVNGIANPEDMRRQYKRHPAEHKFAIDDDLVVMFAYPDANIRWTGMVFIHHFPSVSEVVLDYDGNRIYEQVSSPEAQLRMDDLLNDNAFVDDLQIQLSEIWDLSNPGTEVLGLVDSLEATGNKIEFLGGRPQTLFDASMFLIRMNDQDIRVYEFDDEAARRNVSDNISPDGYEFSQQEGEVTTVIHIEYLGQPNFWGKERLLVQYLGTDQTIIEFITAELGPPLTTHRLENEGSSPPASGWQTYSNPYFKITLAYPAHWQHVDGEAHYGDKFAGEDGYFTITAMGDVGLTLDQAVEAEIQHKLQPYGPDPIVEEFQVQGQEARIILPSASQDDYLRWQAALLVIYPRPISLTIGDTEHVYPIFALYADPAHIWGFAESLKFDFGLFEESETFDTSKDSLSCLLISETPDLDCWPANYSIIQIKEQNRRGSIIAYNFHIEGVSQTPYLSEIQLFSEESIEMFTSNCDPNIPCFFGDYPTPERYAGLKAAFIVPAPYQDYALKRFGDRDFFVKNLPCHGDDCIIREYTTFLGDIMAVFWIVMTDETQADLSDQLFTQVIIGQY